MLLITEALLLILAALGQDHRNAAAAVGGQIYPLDMAVNSVDDQYDGCRKKMAELVKGYLEKEISNLKPFNTSWVAGQTYHDKLKSGENNLAWEHFIAIYVYTSNYVYRDFNDAVRNGKQNYTDKKFMWHSLHFLLTEAIQILNETQNACYLTYRGTDVSFNQNALNTEVRFGSFASSSLDHNIAQRFGNISCFEIYTCEGANVTKYSNFSYEQEVLIPPYETFKVTAVKNIIDHPDLWCETVYTLESTGTKSDLNCALVNKPTSIFRKRVKQIKEYICRLFSQLTICKCCG